MSRESRPIAVLCWLLTLNGGWLAMAEASQGTAPQPKETSQADPYRPCQTEDDRIALLLVATDHFANPTGTNLFESEPRDVISETLQKEIEQVVARLADFRPTKVALEWPFGNQSVIENYRSYREGKRNLAPQEQEQVGYRLAGLLASI